MLVSWITLNQEGNITLSDENQICLQSLSGDDMAWVSDMEFSIDNATFKSVIITKMKLQFPMKVFC